MIWVLITSFLWSVFSGLAEYHRIKDRQLYKDGNNEYKKHSKRWHLLEFFDAGFAIGVGVAIGFDGVAQNNLWIYVAYVLMVSAVRWNVRDGIYNMKNGNGFYYRSPNTTSSIEQLGAPVVKIVLFICALIFRVLL